MSSGTTVTFTATDSVRLTCIVSSGREPDLIQLKNNNELVASTDTVVDFCQYWGELYMIKQAMIQYIHHNDTFIFFRMDRANIRLGRSEDGMGLGGATDRDKNEQFR